MRVAAGILERRLAVHDHVAVDALAAAVADQPVGGVVEGVAKDQHVAAGHGAGVGKGHHRHAAARRGQPGGVGVLRIKRPDDHLGAFAQRLAGDLGGLRGGPGGVVDAQVHGHAPAAGVLHRQPRGVGQAAGERGDLRIAGAVGHQQRHLHGAGAATAATEGTGRSQADSASAAAPMAKRRATARRRSREKGMVTCLESRSCCRSPLRSARWGRACRGRPPVLGSNLRRLSDGANIELRQNHAAAGSVSGRHADRRGARHHPAGAGRAGLGRRAGRRGHAHPAPPDGHPWRAGGRPAGAEPSRPQRCRQPRPDSGALREGKSVAYASEAGTPMIADPGYRLVRDAAAAGCAVTTAPGPSAVLAALTCLGCPATGSCSAASRRQSPRRGGGCWPSWRRWLRRWCSTKVAAVAFMRR